jgi:hypothetical protein
VIGYVRVPTTLTAQQEIRVPIDWQTVTVRVSVWTIWSAGQSVAPAGNQSITPRFSMPQYCRYAENAPK